ncbi:MAG TPA: hypothetical protein VHB02_00555 [Acidimicrobiales bacterium]|nr:hypothetical protein [Acidimicrobiales bacterium]
MGVDRLLFPRPTEEFISVDRVPVPGACPACGAEALARYPIANSMGPRIATKCQACFEPVRIDLPTPDDHWPPWARATEGWSTTRAG